MNNINAKNKTENKFYVDSFNEGYVKNISLYAQTNLSPMVSFWGGIVAQEIIKFTGKYTPLR